MAPGSTMIENLTHNPSIADLILATGIGREREKEREREFWGKSK